MLSEIEEKEKKKYSAAKKRLIDQVEKERKIQKNIIKSSSNKEISKK